MEEQKKILALKTEKKPVTGNKKILSIIVAVGVASLLSGFVFGSRWQEIKTNTLPYLGFKKESNVNLNSLSDLYRRLEYYYDGDIDREKLVEGAKKGMVEALGDKYTVYMTPTESNDFKKSLHGDVGAGVGIEMGLRDKYIKVLRTLPDNPARRAGVLAGDIIFKVDGVEVWQLPVDKVAEKVRGAAGSKVKLTVVRDGQEKDFYLIREKINNVSVEVVYKDRVAIIRTTRFDNDTGEKIRREAIGFKQRGINKVILDLRSNGGGYVDAAVDTLSLWIDGEKVLIQKGKNEEPKVSYAKRGMAVLKDIKTVVLVNGQSASASEIVAGALRDYGKAQIVGEKTYGKGVVQSLMQDLSGGAMLKVTTAKWYTPKGVNINKEGIVPDMEVVNSFEDINKGKDPQMEKALGI